jgi:hypothetical protein
MPNLWLGDSYHLPANRLLVLGESWWGDVEPLSDFVPKWAAGRVRDHTFSRLFNACSGLHTETATAEQRLAWWHTIAFYNFVTGSVGDLRGDRPTRAHFDAAAAPFTALMAEIRPRGVWILGKEQAQHSAPLVAAAAIPFEIAPHPTSYGLRSETLRESWTALNARVM